MALEKWAESLALRLQEQTASLSHDDIRKSLADTLKDLFPGQYCYPCDVFGDDSSGDVVYQCGSDYQRAPYEIKDLDGKRACSIDTAQAVDVLPRTVYDEEADEADHYAAMGEAERAEVFAARFPGSEKQRVPFLERFISKDERKAADAGSFAGKDKSFPILKPADVMAAVRSMGRAGSDNYGTATLKANIIRIAKKKGWAKYLPKGWQSGDSKEAAETVAVQLVESAVAFPTDYIFAESSAANPVVKIIDEGRGTYGWYSKEVLKRDGPKIFKAGTLMFVNHATDAEEAARPEGDYNRLAAVTVGNAFWDDNGKAGPALYAPAKVFSDHAAQVQEKAPYTGVSIRAGGTKSERKIAPDGKPGVIEALTSAASIDLVTKAGRGGKLLLEAEQAINLYEAALAAEGEGMDEAAVKQLIEAATAPLLAKIAVLERPKPIKIISRMLESIRLPEPAKEEVIRNLRDTAPLTEAGLIDEPKLKVLVEAEAKRIAQVLQLSGVGNVQGLGAPITAVEAEIAKPEELLKESLPVWEALMGNKEAAAVAARGRLERVA